MDQLEYKIEDGIIYTSDFDGTPDPKGVGHFYYNQMLLNRNKIAQIDGYTQEKDTFGSLLQRSVRTALTMLDKGLKPGDHISLCSNNHLNSAVPHIASYFTGTVMGAIDPFLSVEEAEYLLRQTLPKMIFVSSDAVTLIEEVVERIGSNIEIVVFGDTTRYTPFAELIVPHIEENKFKPRVVQDLNELALIVFSSGSSGRPKGICYSHLNMLWFNKKYAVNGNLTLYAISTPYWGVFPITIHSSIEYGWTRIVYPLFNASEPWTMFYQEIDVAFSNPQHLLEMLRNEIPNKSDLKNVKYLQIGGNPVSPKQMDEIRSKLPYTLVVMSYGQTEVFKTFICFAPTVSGVATMQKNKYSVGTVVRGFSYKVVDVETDQVLGPNQIGELRIKSQSKFMGYYKKDSSECFDSDGWLKTGDLFYYNEDLCFYIVGRIKESFKYHHHHISPVEIEKVILDLEPIDSAVVIGKPHHTDCHHPLAVIKLKPNQKVSAEEIIKYVEDNVEDKKRLRGGVVFVEDIPLTVTGKTDRLKLRSIVLNNKE